MLRTLVIAITWFSACNAARETTKPFMLNKALSAVHPINHENFGMEKKKLKSLECEGESNDDFTTRSNSYERIVMGIRGGAGPLNPLRTAQFATVAVGLETIFGLLFQERQFQSVGLPPAPKLYFIQRRTLFNALGHVSTAALVLFRSQSIKESIAVGLLVRSIPHLQSAMTGKGIEFGPEFGLTKQARMVLVNIATAWMLWNNHPNSKEFMYIWSGVTLITSFLSIFSPSLNSESHVAFFNRFHGFGVLGLLTHYLALFLGTDIIQALGYGIVPATIALLTQNFITKDVEKFGLDKEQQFVRILVLAIFIITLAF